MKKIGAAAIIPLLLIISAFFNEYLSHTGYVVDVPPRSPDDVLVDIKIMAADNALKLLDTGTTICVVVEMNNETTYYYELTKTDSLVDVSYKYCAEPGQDNIIIKFNSYGALQRFKESPKNFIKEMQNIDYYIFPSNYVAPGGAVNCNLDFQSKYCGASLYYFSSDELREIKLDCCADYSLSLEKERLMKQLKLGKAAIEEKPFFLTGIGITVIVLALLAMILIGGISAAMIRKPKIEPALKDYIENLLLQGYPEEQIKQALLDVGWEEKKVDLAVSKIKEQMKK